MSQPNSQHMNLDPNHPCSHPNCFWACLKGLRNGVYYGIKVRLVHALVNAIIYKPQNKSWLQQFKGIIELTVEHSKRLGLYVLLYKMCVCFLNKLRKKQSKYHSLISGAICSYFAFGDKHVVTMQLNLYVLARIIQGAAENINKRMGQEVVDSVGRKTWQNLYQGKFFHIFAVLTWAVVMFLFEDTGTLKNGGLQNSLYQSMDFLYKQCDQPLKHWTELIPLHIPNYLKNKFGI